MTWVDLSSAFGYGTKLTSTQMQNLRDNITALANGDSGAPAIKEAAVDTGAITVNKLGDSAVAQAKLKTTTHEQSTVETTWQPKCLTYADYAFAFRCKTSLATQEAYFCRASQAANYTFDTTSYVGEYVYIKATSGYTAYAIYRYVQASGEVYWVWLLRDKETGLISDGDAAGDVCCWGRDPSERPHPFTEIYDPEKHDIVLWTPDQDELRELYARGNNGDRHPLQVALEDFYIDEETNMAWPDKPCTTKILCDDSFEAMLKGEPVRVLQQVIPPSPDVLVKQMRPNNKCI